MNGNNRTTRRRLVTSPIVALIEETVDASVIGPLVLMGDKALANHTRSERLDLLRLFAIDDRRDRFNTRLLALLLLVPRHMFGEQTVLLKLATFHLACL